MGKIAKYDADPVYSIQVKPDEYVDTLGNIDFDDETKGIILGLKTI